MRCCAIGRLLDQASQRWVLAVTMWLSRSTRKHVLLSRGGGLHRCVHWALSLVQCSNLGVAQCCQGRSTPRRHCNILTRPLSPTSPTCESAGALCPGRRVLRADTATPNAAAAEGGAAEDAATGPHCVELFDDLTSQLTHLRPRAKVEKVTHAIHERH